MSLSLWNRLLPSKSRTTTRRRPARQLTLEPLEARELMTVQFTPTPFTSRPNSPDIDLGLSSFDLNFQINEPLVAVNPTNPANIAISSWDGLRVSTDYGSTFSTQGPSPGHASGTTWTKFPTDALPSLIGDSGMTFDSTGRL